MELTVPNNTVQRPGEKAARTGQRWPPLSAEPMPFDCERIVYSGVGCLITKEK